MTLVANVKSMKYLIVLVIKMKAAQNLQDPMWAEVEYFQVHNFRQLIILIFKSQMLICFQVKSVPKSQSKNISK